MSAPIQRPLCASLWFIASLFIGCMNDVVTKALGGDLHPLQVICCRLILGAVTLLAPFWFRKKGQRTLTTRRLWLHVLRGVMLASAMLLWGYGLQCAPLTMATLMSFTVPIFVLIMAPVVLKERVTRKLWVITLLGFAGIALALQQAPGQWGFHAAAIYFVPAAMLFGGLDVLNRKYIHQEPQSCMLFYSTLIAGLCLLPWALKYWIAPAVQQWGWLMLLGVGGNLLLYCLLQAFSLTQLGVLEPLRYLELLIAAGLGWLLFNELPSNSLWLGAVFIIPCSLYVVLHQTKKIR